MNDFYIVINSNHCQNLFDNSSSNFRVKLNRPLRLGEGWKVALYQFRSPAPSNIYICSNICASTIVGVNQFNLLRYITNSKQRDLIPYYVPVTQHFIDYIQIYMIDASTEEKLETLTAGSTIMMLHFVYKP